MNISKRRERLREERGRNLCVMYRSTAIAMIFSELSGVLTILADGIIASRFLGVDVYSGISLLKPFTSIVLMIAGFFSTGCNIVCSQLVGIGDKEKINEAFNLTFFLSVLVGAVLMAVCLLFPTGILTISGVALDKYPALNVHLYDYLRGYMPAILFLILIQVLGPLEVMDGGKKLYPVSCGVICVADIIGDLLNVLVFHGGAFGMGLATSVSYAVGLLILLPHFLKTSQIFHLSLKNIRFSCLREIAKKGTPSLVKRLSGTLRDILVNYLNMIVALTAAAIAARGIQNDLFTFLFCIPSGLGRTLLTMVGIHYSANDLQGLKRLYIYAHRYGFMLSAAAGLITFLLAPQLTAIYTSDPEVTSLAIFSIRWMSVALVFDTASALIQHYFQGIGDMKKANRLSLCERFVIPVACAFLFGTLYGSRGILMSAAISKMVLMLIVFISNCIYNRGIPKNWADIMFLPKDFGGSETDNIYAEIRTMDDVLRASHDSQVFCLQHGASPRQAMLIALFVEEMTENVIQHAEKMKLKPPVVDFRLYVNKEGKFCFSLMDLSDQFDPTMYYELHRGDSPEEHIGIRMVTDMAADIRYFSTFSSNNLVVYLD